MKTCASCGNNYGNTFQITMNHQQYNFDCFECAIAKLAPICQNCGCKVIGHGIDSEDFTFCCSHCARRSEENANAKLLSS